MKNFKDLIAVCAGRVRLGPFEYPAHDYPWSIREVESMEELIEQFLHGNWAARTGFVLGDLAFIEQASGANEWLTLKLDSDEWKSFDSISFYAMLKQHGQEACQDYIQHLQEIPWDELKKYTAQTHKQEQTNEPQPDMQMGGM